MSVETMEFKTELKQLMDIITHSLYSEKEIFLRELISNASDAIDKARFESLTDEKLLEGDDDWAIRITADEEAKTLTLSDNGIGMSSETIVNDLGTIARSGTKAFLEKLKESKETEQPGLIGQFGVGFYSAFMVAESVSVTSRAAGSDKAVKWESTGEGTFTLEDVEKESRGTEIVLQMREEDLEMLKGWKIRSIVKRFSNFIEYPIVMKEEVDVEVEEGEEKKTELKDATLNDQKAIWLRDKADVTKDEYKEFYKHISHDFQEPAQTIHYHAEGTVEFRSLMFLPSARPMNFFMDTQTPQLHLYINRVFITDACESLLPTYLRFVSGVVDSADLPLNVSREMMHDHPLIAKMRASLTSKVLSTMAKMKTKEFDEFVKVYEAFGPVLKEGLNTDFANKEKIAGLLLFRSALSEDDKYVSLDEYVEAMAEGQEAIYYLCGDNAQALKHSPYIESFSAKGQNVLLLTDPIDAFAMESLGTFKDKAFKAVDKGEHKEEEKDEATKAQEEEFKPLLASLNETLEGVKEVRLSTRLKTSAACLVADEHGMSAHMERLMAQMHGNNAGMETPRVLELNPENEAVKTVLSLYTANADDKNVVEYGKLFYDQALLAEGSPISNFAEFAARVNSLIVKANTD